MCIYHRLHMHVSVERIGVRWGVRLSGVKRLCEDRPNVVVAAAIEKFQVADDYELSETEVGQLASALDLDSAQGRLCRDTPAPLRRARGDRLRLAVALRWRARRGILRAGREHDCRSHSLP